jgi:hypothetical protein
MTCFKRTPRSRRVRHRYRHDPTYRARRPSHRFQLRARARGTCHGVRPDSAPSDGLDRPQHFHRCGRKDIPLRIGRYDAPTKDGFGYRHIIDGHDELSDERDIGPVLGRSNSLCKYFSQDDRYRCSSQIGDRAIFVVFSERVDPEAPDGRPVGIITAYYSPRECPC